MEGLLKHAMPARIRPAGRRSTPWSLGPETAVPGDAGVVAGRRFYSPGIGRWTSGDPIGEGGGVNLYILVHNGPSGATDVLGLFHPDCVAATNKIRNQFAAVRDIPPATSAAEFLSEGLADQVAHVGIEHAVIILKVSMICICKDGQAGPTSDFYGVSVPLSSGDKHAVHLGVAIDGVGAGKTLRKLVYGRGISSSSLDYSFGCCQCSAKMRFSSIVHGHSYGEKPSIVDMALTTDEPSYVLYRWPAPAGPWKKHGWHNGKLLGQEPL